MDQKEQEQFSGQAAECGEVAEAAEQLRSWNQKLVRLNRRARLEKKGSVGGQVVVKEDSLVSSGGAKRYGGTDENVSAFANQQPKDIRPVSQFDSKEAEIASNKLDQNTSKNMDIAAISNQYLNKAGAEYQLNPEFGMFSTKTNPQVPKIGLKMPEISRAKNSTDNNGQQKSLKGPETPKSWRDKVQQKRDELYRRLQQDMQAVNLSRDSGNITLLDASNFKVSPTVHNMFLQPEATDSEYKNSSQRAHSRPKEAHFSGSMDFQNKSRMANRSVNARKANKGVVLIEEGSKKGEKQEGHGVGSRNSRYGGTSDKSSVGLCGSAFNFDELISKRLKQRKKCREVVMDQIKSKDDVLKMLGGASSTPLGFLGSDNGIGGAIPFPSLRSRSGLRNPYDKQEGNLRSDSSYTGSSNVQGTQDWRLPEIGSTRNRLLSLPFSIKLIPCELAESEEDLQSYDVFKTQAIEKAINMSESFDPALKNVVSQLNALGADEQDFVLSDDYKQQINEKKKISRNNSKDPVFLTFYQTSKSNCEEMEDQELKQVKIEDQQAQNIQILDNDSDKQSQNRHTRAKSAEPQIFSAPRRERVEDDDQEDEAVKVDQVEQQQAQNMSQNKSKINQDPTCLPVESFSNGQINLNIDLEHSLMNPHTQRMAPVDAPLHKDPPSEPEKPSQYSNPYSKKQPNQRTKTLEKHHSQIQPSKQTQGSSGVAVAGVVSLQNQKASTTSAVQSSQVASKPPQTKASYQSPYSQKKQMAMAYKKMHNMMLNTQQKYLEGAQGSRGQHQLAKSLVPTKSTKNQNQMNSDIDYLFSNKRKKKKTKPNVQKNEKKDENIDKKYHTGGPKETSTSNTYLASHLNRYRQLKFKVNRENFSPNKTQKQPVEEPKAEEVVEAGTLGAPDQVMGGTSGQDQRSVKEGVEIRKQQSSQQGKDDKGQEEEEVVVVAGRGNEDQVMNDNGAAEVLERSIAPQPCEVVPVPEPPQQIPSLDLSTQTLQQKAIAPVKSSWSRRHFKQNQGAQNINNNKAYGSLNQEAKPQRSKYTAPGTSRKQPNMQARVSTEANEVSDFERANGSNLMVGHQTIRSNNDRNSLSESRKKKQKDLDVNKPSLTTVDLKLFDVNKSSPDFHVNKNNQDRTYSQGQGIQPSSFLSKASSFVNPYIDERFRDKNKSKARGSSIGEEYMNKGTSSALGNLQPEVSRQVLPNSFNIALTNVKNKRNPVECLDASIEAKIVSRGSSRKPLRTGSSIKMFNQYLRQMSKPKEKVHQEAALVNGGSELGLQMQRSSSRSKKRRTKLERLNKNGLGSTDEQFMGLNRHNQLLNRNHGYDSQTIGQKSSQQTDRTAQKSQKKANITKIKIEKQDMASLCQLQQPMSTPKSKHPPQQLQQQQQPPQTTTNPGIPIITAPAADIQSSYQTEAVSQNYQATTNSDQVPKALLADLMMGQRSQTLASYLAGRGEKNAGYGKQRSKYTSRRPQQIFLCKDRAKSQMTVASIDQNSNSNTSNSRQQVFLPQTLGLRNRSGCKVSKRSKVKTAKVPDVIMGPEPSVEQVKAYMVNMRAGCKSQMI